MPCEVCIFSFLKKILNVFQKKKNDKKPVLIPDIIFFLLRRFQNTEKSFKEFIEDFFFTQWRRKRKSGMDTVGHTASTILVVQIMTEN